MKSIVTTFLKVILLTVVFLSACVSVTSEKEPTVNVKNNARELFAYPRVPVFRLTMPQADWLVLKKNCRDEKYVPAEAWFEGTRIGTIGIRFKGNVGSLGQCFNKAGEFICSKLSMKMKFDEYEKKNKFYGLKRLNFHAYRWDASYMNERLAYSLFQSMGIIAPRMSWAMLIVNNEPLGLFGMVEEIDGRFTADRWPEFPDGNLYKETWPGIADQAWLESQLETNNKISNVNAFLAFSNAMAAAKPDERRETLGRYTDLDYLARYMAVDDGIANFDGITAFYESPTQEWEGAGNHNYFFYQSGRDTFTLIPWDLGSTFSLGGGFMNVPRWTVVPEDCSKYYPVWQGDIGVNSPGCDKVFRALAADTGAYRKACRKFLDGPFQEKTMSEMIDRYAAFIRNAVKADPNGPGIDEFESSIKTLKQSIPRLRDRLESFLSGETHKSLEVDIKDRLDFETYDNSGLVMGPALYSNPNTSVSVKLNTTAPLAGKQDLLYSFQFADERDAWNQWTMYSIPMAAGSNDLTRKTGIRLLACSEDERILRLELDSPDQEKGIRYGWDIKVTKIPTQIEVKFTDATLPSWVQKKEQKPGKVLANVIGLIVSPQCGKRGLNGRLGTGKKESGSVRIDNLEFY